MAQVSQKKPVAGGVNGQSKDKNSKYESNWGQVIGARGFPMNQFLIKASELERMTSGKMSGKTRMMRSRYF